ncbi:ATP-dependent zinc protease [Photobacterium sp.]|uniref:ATP-dependent zinc protease family protein n=1 Tax=Photobacterium sp. TaxID=660 RepID=UPI00299DB940|nr:ATP-dependent zinc protease [Photobacterium sp.]MDX1302058.1 ATP-dependent zinc protease [Photobacterium sp.]
MGKKKVVLGWREWVDLPVFGIAVKAKVDTGAKTCALHAFRIEPYQKEGESWVLFNIHPYQNDVETAVECHARLVDQRDVTDSGGHTEQRYVILTTISIGAEQVEAEVTLTDRECMRFRMLLGRNVLNNRFLVDPVKSYLLGPPFRKKQVDSDSGEDEDL